MNSRRIFQIALSAILGLLLSAWWGWFSLTSPQVQAQDQLSGEMTFYTSDPDSVINQLVNDFNEIYPDITINIFRSGGTEVVARLQAEEEAGEIQADAIMVADGAYVRSLAEKGLLLTYRPEDADMAPDNYHYFDDQAHDVRTTFVVLGYNTELVDTPPTSYFDLLDPDYQGRVGTTNPFFNGTAFSQLGTFVNDPRFGWEFYEDWKENDVRFEQGNTGLAAKVANGEYAIANLVDVVIRGLVREGSPVAYVWPEEGALQIPTPFAILKDSENVELAQTFLDYLYTQRAQQLYLDIGLVSVRSDMPIPDDAEGELEVFEVDLDYIEENREAIREQFGELFGGA